MPQRTPYNSFVKRDYWFDFSEDDSDDSLAYLTFLFFSDLPYPKSKYSCLFVKTWTITNAMHSL